MAIFYTDSASFNSLTVTGSTVISASSNNESLKLIGSGSNIFSVTGSGGGIFAITDTSPADSSLFSVSSGSITIFSVDLSKNVSISGSTVITGSLNVTAGITGSHFGTSSWANNAQTSSYILNAISASYSSTANTASYILQAVSASFATNASTSSYILNAISSSYTATASSADNFTVRNTLTAQTLVVQTITSSIDYVTGSTRFGSLQTNTHLFTGSVSITGSLNVVGAGITGSLLGTSSWATNSTTSSFITTAQTASYVLQAVSSSFATNASTASYILNAVSSSYASTASYVVTANTASYVLNAVSASFATNASTSSYILNAVSSSFTTQAANASTASYVLNAISSSFATNASTASYITTAQTASYVLQAVSSSFATNASTASYILQAVSASFATQAINASTASYILNAVSSSYAATASLAPLYVLTSVTSSMSVATASYVFQAVSASFGSTASYVNTLNQNVLITGSLTVGATSAGTTENTLIIGPAPAGGAGEGGQLLLQAKGDTGYTSASMLDTWQNQFRILRGTNAASDALVAQWNLQTKQMQLPAYNSVSAFPGTAVANLAVDSTGSIITVSTSGGSVFPYTGVAAINGGLIVTGSITASSAIHAQANNAMYFRGGDDAEFWDINVVNTVGIYGQQNQDRAGIKLGSAGPTLFGSGSNLGIGTITPSNTLQVVGGITATSFTGSLLGTATTASYVLQAVSSSFATLAQTSNTASYVVTAQTASFVTTAQTASYVLQAVSASFASTASSADNFTVRSTLTAQTLVVQTITSSIDYVTGSTRFGSLITNTHLFTGSVSITGSLGVTGSINATDFTGSLLGTSSWATNAVTSSYILNAVSASYASVSQTANTASYVLNAVSASYARTSSYSDNFTVSTTLIIDGTMTDYSLINSSIVGANNLFTQATGSYTSAFFKYTAASASNARSGEVMVVWNGANTQYTDFSTVDIGTTTAVTSSATIVTGQVQFNIQTNSSGWKIKSLATYI